MILVRRSLLETLLLSLAAQGDDYSTQNALLSRLGVFAPLLALNAVVAIRSARPGVLGVLPRVTGEEAT